MIAGTATQVGGIVGAKTAAAAAEAAAVTLLLKTVVLDQRKAW